MSGPCGPTLPPNCPQAGIGSRPGQWLRKTGVYRHALDPSKGGPDKVPVLFLPHACGVLLLADGVQVKGVQSRFGHWVAAVTTGIQPHALDRGDRRQTIETVRTSLSPPHGKPTSPYRRSVTSTQTTCQGLVRRGPSVAW